MCIKAHKEYAPPRRAKRINLCTLSISLYSVPAAPQAMLVTGTKTECGLSDFIGPDKLGC